MPVKFARLTFLGASSSAWPFFLSTYYLLAVLTEVFALHGWMDGVSSFSRRPLNNITIHIQLPLMRMRSPFEASSSLSLTVSQWQAGVPNASQDIRVMTQQVNCIVQDNNYVREPDRGPIKSI